MELDKLRKIAEDEETQKWGGWALEEDDWDGYCVYINDGGFGRSYVAEKMSQGESDGKSTAKFIATFDPPTVLALLKRIEYLEGQARRNYKDWQISSERTEQAEQAVARVRKEHAERVLVYPNGDEEHYCSAEEDSAWPCSTIRALDGEGIE